mmetsp:Transcript_63696/g.179295  ORF Transcript_63696/g.179295 Transcript_63696/m.179295 type:complete len:301 (-) Transcript_63696:96-998(-)
MEPALLSAGGCGACLIGVVLSWKKLTKPCLKKALAKQVSAAGTKALAGSELEVGEISISLGREASVTVNDIKVGNPQGYKSEKLVSVRTVAVSVDLAGAARMCLASCGKPKEIRIVSVAIHGCDFIFEKQSITDSNLNTFLRNLKEAESASDEAEGAGGPKVPDMAAVTGAMTSLVNKGKDALAKGKAGGDASKKPAGPAVIIGRVEVAGTLVEITSTSQLVGTMKGKKMPIKDILFEDFSKTVGSASLRKCVNYLVEDVLINLMKTIGAPITKGLDVLKGRNGAEDDGEEEGGSWCPVL